MGQFPTHHWIGDLILLQVLKTTMNRFIALSVVLAVAAAEADPQLLLPALVSPHAKADALVEYPNGAKVPADTLSVQAARAAHLATKPFAYGYPVVGHYLGKREAEAEADPDAWYGLYGGYHGFGYGYHHPLITSVGAFTTYANGAVVPTNTPAVQAATNAHLAAKAHITAAHGLYHGYGHLGYYGHYLGKRSADAEADPWFAAYYAPYPAVTSTTAEGQTTYSNGAVVPTHQANLDATAAHLATTYPRPAYLGYYYG